MTDRIPPIPMQWDGEALRPVSPYWAREADKHYVVGDKYPMAPEYGRSVASHNHLFAWLEPAWHSLPECYGDERWAETPETLRKHALIKCGFHHTTILDIGAKAPAIRVRDALQAAETKLHGYAIGMVRGPIVQIWTPESMSKKHMDRARFQQAKQAIMEWIADILSVSTADLQRMGEAA
ncbi:hypothetical protein ACT6QG_05495 [Xanthobacter sp. TB0136]|uniref:hypothetical protein n=1 Tax=Xanthobacter sp. TB0136 TaxID=3459177 RepID=UPI0040398F3F